MQDKPKLTQTRNCVQSEVAMIQKTTKHESVCAWCRHEYDDETGERGRYLTKAEYAEIESHGCCRICARAMLAEAGEN